MFRHASLSGTRFDELPTPPETAAPSPAASPTDQPVNNEQDDLAYRGVDDEGDYPCAEVDTQLRQQPISDERPDNADYQVAAKAVATTAHDVASKPPGYNANDNDSDETFIR